ncbi:hypothetical protein P0Y35_06545 [Kiritimatiellaeota bacterium B1221]|nr:hypothetical protein [Kiritimatiellaeota bacterium B1221]
MKKLILLILLASICSANDSKMFISASEALDGSWKAVLEVDREKADSSYWIPTQAIPVSPAEAIEKVRKSAFLKAYSSESVLVTRCVLWAQHLALSSKLLLDGDPPPRIPQNALVAHYTIDVNIGGRSYPFMVLMDGTVISPRIEGQSLKP